MIRGPCHWPVPEEDRVPVTHDVIIEADELEKLRADRARLGALLESQEARLREARDGLRELRAEIAAREKRWQKALKKLLDMPAGEFRSLGSAFRAMERMPAEELTDEGRAALAAWRDVQTLLDGK